MSASGPRPVVIARFDDVSLSEATPIICAQAKGWLGGRLGGAPIRVQQHRGKAPAVEAGTIQC